MKDLLQIRDELDEIDAKIVELYLERMKRTNEVGEYKRKTGKPVFDKEREDKKLDAVSAMVEDDGLKHGIRELFEQIMSISRKRQYQMLGGSTQAGITDCQWCSQLEKSGRKVVFQGTDGAYSQVAMQAFFKDESESFHVETWRDAMEALDSGEADYAVLPLENTTAGIVSENYDLIAEYNHYIVGELVIKVEHALLGLPGAKLSDIRTVLSHPQALFQCSKFLEEHREWEKASMKNTAVSAKKIKEDMDKTQAAIANRLTAKLYGLDILADKIINVDTNATRFIIVSAEEMYEEKADKISICFELPHESGSLYHMLSHFIFNDLNMTKIQSRPIPGRNWEYRFFADFEGNLKEPAVKNALYGIRQEAAGFKILGNYCSALTH